MSNSPRNHTSGFRNIHPMKTGSFTGDDLPQEGQSIKVNESRFVRCRFCLSINDTELRPKGNGWDGNTTFESVPDSNTKNPVVGGAGCWFCASSNYY